MWKSPLAVAFFSSLLFNSPLPAQNYCEESEEAPICCDSTYCDPDCEEAACECDRPDFLRYGHILAIGPEFYHLKRTREGGTRQDGTPIGVRASYDHIKRYKFYWGAQAFYGSGILKGKTSADDKIKSRWTEQLIEGNVGYTFQYKYYPYVSFTPFGGYGYYRETNKFMNPSPVHLRFVTDYGYYSFGFLSNILVNSWLSAGINVRLRYPTNPTSTVKDDPDFDDITLKIGDFIQGRIEVPLVYCTQFFCNRLQIGVVPFYDRKEYGKRATFIKEEDRAVNYLKTVIETYGLNLQLIYRF